MERDSLELLRGPRESKGITFLYSIPATMLMGRV